MKTRILLLVVLVTLSVSGYATIWVITNSGDTFTPPSITIAQGDTVNFVLESHHNAMQVSMATWNANGSTLLSGGFQTNFGGGFILPSQLSSGTNYYVCTPHASIGMKGTIVVQVTTDADEIVSNAGRFSIYPNPASGKFNIEVGNLRPAETMFYEVLNLQGKKIISSSLTETRTEINLGDNSKGIYLVRVIDGDFVMAEKVVNR
jgi:plastocyanin